MDQKKWLSPHKNTSTHDLLSKELDIHPAIVHILINRGITTPASAKLFLYPELQDMHDPFTMKGMDKAVSRIMSAIQNNEKICIYGDYDVDGITGSSLLTIFFKEIGFPVLYYIPDRIAEGYGIKEEGLQAIKEQGVALVITVDCGIGSYHEVEKAKTMAMDMIITDHHQLPDRIPDAWAVLNPAQPDCNYPYKSLAGVGIAYKLLIALRIRLRKEKKFKDTLPNLKRHLDLVALGSIADIVPCKGENRVFIKYGLDEIEHTDKVGLSALKSVSNMDSKSINVYDVGFSLAPRINAAGRIANPKSAVELLTSDDKKKALTIAATLDASNKERQKMQEKILHEVKEKIASEVDLKKDKVIVLSSEEWHPGIIGIVASKIIDDYYRPTILISLDGEKGRGSARSIASFHLYEGLKECSSLLDTFGGHRLAAGLSIQKKCIDEFRRYFNAVVDKKNSPEDFIPTITIDYEMPLEDLSIPFVKNLDLLQPYGASNAQPIFISTGLSIKNCSVIGKQNTHIKFMVTNDTYSVEAIGFNMAYLREKYDFETSMFDVLYTPQLNKWHGTTKVQLKVRDVRTSIPFPANQDIEKPYTSLTS